MQAITSIIVQLADDEFKLKAYQTPRQFQPVGLPCSMPVKIKIGYSETIYYLRS